MKGKHYDIIQDIQKASTAVLMAIPKTEYSDCFENFFHRFQHCVDSEKVYFELENKRCLVFFLVTVALKHGQIVYVQLKNRILTRREIPLCLVESPVHLDMLCIIGAGLFQLVRAKSNHAEIA